LRTPLTSLTVNLALMAENPGHAQTPQLAAEALAQAGELTTLVNDLVDLARYGEAPVHTKDVRLDLVAQRVLDRRVTAFDLNSQPTLVHGDHDALERAVANLIDNAVKWSPPEG
jgi:two-component system sensor histidine kinase MprB